jgi:hypothetical protein
MLDKRCRFPRSQASSTWQWRTVLPSEFLFGAYAARRDGARTKAGFSTAGSPMANAATTQTGLSGVHRHEIVNQHF